MNDNENPRPEADWQRDQHDEQIENALRGELMPACPRELHNRVRDRINLLRSQSNRNRVMVVVGLLAGIIWCGNFLAWRSSGNQVTNANFESPRDWARVSYSEFEPLFDPPAITVVRFVEVQQDALLGSLDREERKNAVE